MSDVKKCTACGGNGRSWGLFCLGGEGKTMQVTQPCGVCGGSGQIKELELFKQMSDQRITTSQDIIEQQAAEIARLRQELDGMIKSFGYEKENEDERR